MSTPYPPTGPLPGQEQQHDPAAHRSPYGPGAASQPYAPQPYAPQLPAPQPYAAQDLDPAQHPYAGDLDAARPQDPYAAAAAAAHPAMAPAWGTAAYAPGYGYGYPSNGLAVWSLVLGVVGVVLAGPLAGVPALITGVLARRAVAEGRADNGGLATAGIVLGAVGTGFGLLGLLFVLAPLLLVGASSF
ncbi:DUF4190 domain-containing protein [Cellulomonas endometrii]|uniref:DUF4190 domain-containing protein n=1 Tax=Cellulomonas endometrii TaxID=3036301 RepID=UPI0024AE57AF|nr:DUF4190 domain-containing protein [Cellulomonas endometrii]